MKISQKLNRKQTKGKYNSSKQKKRRKKWKIYLSVGVTESLPRFLS